MISAALFCVLILAAPGRADQPPAEPAARQPDIESLINDLGARDFSARRAADKQLRAIGLPALEHLERAAQSENSRIKRAATRILRDVRLGITPDWPADLILLARYYPRTRDLDRRRDALRRIADTMQEKAVPLLVEAMASESEAEGGYALVCFKRINSEKVCRKLLDVLKKPANSAQTRAVALARTRLGMEFDPRHVLGAGDVDDSTRTKMQESAVVQLLAQLSQQEFDEVAEYGERFAKASPDDPRFPYLQAEALIALGRPDEAQACQKQALALNPKKELPHYNAADLLTTLGRRRLAALEWLAILAMPPHNSVYDVNAHLALARIYEESGLFEKAADSLASALDAYKKARAAGVGIGYDLDKIRVARWGLLNGRPHPLTRAERGDPINLVVHEFDAHPELNAEVLWDTLDDNFDLSLYVDPTLGPTGLPAIAGIRVTPSQVWMSRDLEFQMKAVLVDQYGNPFDGKINWSVERGGGLDPGMYYGGSRYFDAAGSAGDGTVDENGVFKGKEGETGTVRVVASADDDPAVKGSGTLGVGHVPAIIPGKNALLRLGSKGDMKRARVYARALTPEEIAEHAEGKGLETRDNALVGDWIFEKLIYGTYASKVGVGMNAKVVGDVEQITDDDGTYLRMGNGAYLQVAQNRRLNFYRECTLEAWIRTQRSTNYGPIISKFPCDWWGFNFEHEAGSLRLRAMGDISVHYKFTPGAWTHLVAVLAGNGHMLIYANGKLLKEQKPFPFIVYW